MQHLYDEVLFVANALRLTVEKPHTVLHQGITIRIQHVFVGAWVRDVLYKGSLNIGILLAAIVLDEQGLLRRSELAHGWIRHQNLAVCTECDVLKAVASGPEEVVMDTIVCCPAN
jgi:hypothetical protein